MFIFAPRISLALIFSEIMYDPKGSDTDREWVEVFNDGEAVGDFAAFGFFEDETNHKLTPLGQIDLPAGGYAVIAENAEIFLAEYGECARVFDSSFSLKNSGEEIALKNKAGQIFGQVLYRSDWGAGNTGESLTNFSGQYLPRTPTPCAGNKDDVISGDGTDGGVQNQNNSANNSSAPNSGSGNKATEKNITVTIEKVGAILSGAPQVFEAKAYGLLGEPLKQAEFHWAFGDGDSGRGGKAEKTFFYPGDYVVSVTAVSGEYSATDYREVSVLPPKFSLEVVSEDGSLLLLNQTKELIDLSGWMLGYSSDLFGKKFVIPEGTKISAGKSVRFSPEVTKLKLSASESPKIFFRNGQSVPLANEATLNLGTRRETATKKVSFPAESLAVKSLPASEPKEMRGPADLTAKVATAANLTVSASEISATDQAFSASSVQNKPRTFSWFSVFILIVLAIVASFLGLGWKKFLPKNKLGELDEKSAEKAEAEKIRYDTLASSYTIREIGFDKAREEK